MPSRITLATRGFLKKQAALWEILVRQFTHLNTMFTELFADNTVVCFPVTLHASKTIHNLFHARREYTVTSITWVGDIAQAITGTVVKASGTATPAAATTPMCAAGAVVCNTTAHTPLDVALTGTTANLLLASGDRIAIVLSGALTTGSGLLIVRMTRA
jgi:hypothetical protein